MADARTVTVFTDGACQKNGRAGALGGLGVFWGIDDPRNVSANVPDATNNICELMAIDVALDTIKREPAGGLVHYVIATDSKYAIQCVTTWYAGFVRRNWMAVAKGPVKNKELIVCIKTKLEALRDTVTLVHVKGHSGNPGNDAADRLAVAGCAL
jgi:ribonuclease HI